MRKNNSTKNILNSLKSHDTSQHAKHDPINDSSDKMEIDNDIKTLVQKEQRKETREYPRNLVQLAKVTPNKFPNKKITQLIDSHYNSKTDSKHPSMITRLK